MQTIFAILVLGILFLFTMSNTFCFLIGAKVGQKVVKGEKITLPKPPDPLKAIRDHRAATKSRLEAEKNETIIYNMEIYDGTATGQREIPRR